MDLDDLRRKLRGQPTKAEDADKIAKALKMRELALKSVPPERIGQWLKWRSVIDAGQLVWEKSCPWCQSPAFVTEKYGKACSKPECARRWDGPDIECEHCTKSGATLVNAMTAYEGGNPPLMLCDDCDKEYTEYWNEMWKDYNSGRL
jgi:hypothetical protein